MKIQFWSIGKQHEAYVKEGVDMFTKRIQNYYPADWKIVPVPKNAGVMKEDELKKKEGELLLSMISKEDFIIALDERGKSFTSTGLAELIQKCANASRQNVIFIIGGAFGLHHSLIARADVVWSLSELVFPHQLVRLILAEQCYRACTIQRNEKYHHS